MEAFSSEPSQRHTYPGDLLLRHDGNDVPNTMKIGRIPKFLLQASNERVFVFVDGEGSASAGFWRYVCLHSFRAILLLGVLPLLISDHRTYPPFLAFVEYCLRLQAHDRPRIRAGNSSRLWRRARPGRRAHALPGCYYFAGLARKTNWEPAERQLLVRLTNFALPQIVLNFCFFP